MRERWFFVQGEKRRGPFGLTDLVAALRSEPNPRAVLVWRKGLRDWTLAEVVPEVARQLARKSSPDDTLPLAIAEAQPQPGRARWRVALRLWLGVATLAALAGVAAVVLQIRSPGPGRTEPTPVATTPPPATASVPTTIPPVVSASPADGPAATPVPAARVTPPPAGVPALAGEEVDLPRAELPKLRGVAAWSGDTLKLTVYNATSWRVTELHVRIERLSGDDFVPDDRPLTLVPPVPRVEAGVADLLARVAPDRKKPGLNPLDTGVFEARAGTPPEGFRWELESARGYPPAR